MTSNDNHQSGSSSSLDGTVLITEANCSLALSFVDYLLASYPSFSAILAVRDASDSDPNTANLRSIASRFPSAKVSIETLDLASLSDVRSFADTVAARVSVGEISPLSAVVCNAFAWSLLGPNIPRMDMNSVFKSRTYRISSKTKASSIPWVPEIPENLEEIIKPTEDEKGQEMSRGFQRYSNSKFAEVMFMDSLNKKLQQNISLQNITATAMDPGGLPTSRCFQGAPLAFRGLIYIVGNFILPMAQYFTNAVTTTKTSGGNLVAMSVGSKHNGARGYFVGQKAAISAAESPDEEIQEKLWKACEKWSRFEESESVLKT